jgi:mRNA interferase MazF
MKSELPVDGRRILRGEVYVGDYSRYGAPLLKNRPAVVIQNNKGNFHSGETILALIRSAAPRGMLPIFVLLPRGTVGLEKDSIVDGGQLFTVPRAALGRRIGTLPTIIMAAIDQALRISLAL